MGENWYLFASKSDVDARDFYDQLLVAKADGHGWTDTWVKVPKRLVINVHRGIYGGENAVLYTGLDWVKVATYESKRLYVRLPEQGEFD